MSYRLPATSCQPIQQQNPTRTTPGSPASAGVAVAGVATRKSRITRTRKSGIRQSAGKKAVGYRLSAIGQSKNNTKKKLLSLYGSRKLSERNVPIDFLLNVRKTLQNIILEIRVGRLLGVVSSLYAPILQAAVIIPDSADVGVAFYGRISVDVFCEVLSCRSADEIALDIMEGCVEHAGRPPVLVSSVVEVFD